MLHALLVRTPASAVTVTVIGAGLEMLDLSYMPFCTFMTQQAMAGIGQRTSLTTLYISGLEPVDHGRCACLAVCPGHYECASVQHGFHLQNQPE